MGESNFVKLLPLKMDDLIKKHVVLETGKKIEKASITESEKEALIVLWSNFPKNNDRIDISEYKSCLSSLKKPKALFVVDNLDSIVSFMTKTKEEKKEIIYKFYPYSEIIEGCYGQYAYYFDRRENKNVIDILSSIYFDMEVTCRRNVFDGVVRDTKNRMNDISILECFRDSLTEEEGTIYKIKEYLERKYSSFRNYPEIKSILDYSKSKTYSSMVSIINLEIKKLFSIEEKEKKNKVESSNLESVNKFQKSKKSIRNKYQR